MQPACKSPYIGQHYYYVSWFLGKGLCETDELFQVRRTRRNGSVSLLRMVGRINYLCSVWYNTSDVVYQKSFLVLQKNIFKDIFLEFYYFSSNSVILATGLVIGYTALFIGYTFHVMEHSINTLSWHQLYYCLYCECL